MGNRRLGSRNHFKFKRNYIIPLICIIITCTTLVISTAIITNLKRTIKANEINESVVAKNISKEDKVNINKQISFMMSNLDIGEKLDDDNVRYYLTCKKYSQDNDFDKIPKKNINDLDYDIYRNLGYVIFDDLKETYYCISKDKYVETYSTLFDESSINLDIISKYYISSIDSYVVPKNNDIYTNSEYKVNSVKYDKTEDVYVVVMLEVNLIKLYENKNIDEIEKYLDSDEIDSDYLKGNKVELKLIKQKDNYVFKEYSI